MMRRWVLLLLVLVIVPGLLWAQVAVTPSGWATTAGPAVPLAQPGPLVVTTPDITLGTYSPSPVGATNATANNVAGASNSTLDNVPPEANSTQMWVEYSHPYPTVVGAGGQYASPTASAPARSPYFDRGAGQFVSAYDIGAPQPSASLGQVARQFRQQRQVQNARTFTNQDVDRIDQQYGPPTGGVSATAVNAGASTTGETAAAAPPEANVGTGATPAQPPPPPQQARVEYPQPAPPSAPAQANAAGAQLPPASSTSNANEPNQTGSRRNLPVTASHLPSLLLVGASVFLVGMLLRRRNNGRSGVGF